MSSGGGGLGSSISGGFSSVGGGIGSALGGLLGATQVAGATGDAANAQLAGQQADRATVTGMAAPTSSELQNLQQAIAVNQQNIQQGQSLIDSTSPALQQAGAQALALMNGQSAASLAPIQNQRNQQRAQLTSQLQQQLGSGYATSSAGIQALNNFDQQTSNLMTNAQQSAIGQYLGTSQNAYQLGAAQQHTGSSGLLSANQQSSGFRQQQLNAFMNSTVNPGLAYAGSIAGAQAQSNFGLNGLFGLVGTALGGSGGKGATNGNYGSAGGGYEGSSAQQAASNAYGSYDNSIFGDSGGGGGGGGAGIIGSLL